MIRLSIVIPVYNVSQYLMRCIESIIESCGSQYKENVEILLIDDGSTDGSGDLCDKIKTVYEKQIQVIHKENGGLASARNEGLKHLRGEYVLFVDSDDWIEKETVPALMKQIDLSYADIIKFGYNRNENGKVIYSEKPGVQSGLYGKNDIKNILYYEALANGKLFDYSTSFIISVCVSAFKVSVIERSKIIFESERVYLNEDFLFYLKIMHYTSSIAVISDCFYNYDCRCGSLTQCYKENMYGRKMALIDNYYSFAEKNGLVENDLFKARFNQFVIQHMYDCIVAECRWNTDKKKMFRNINTILKDERLKEAFKNLDGITINAKAFAICSVMKKANAKLFYYLYILMKK